MVVRLNSQKKSLEVVESVGVSGKVDLKRTVKYFRLEVSNIYLMDIKTCIISALLVVSYAF